MPKRRPPAGMGRESEETKYLIVQTARRLFLSEGYHAVSTRQITDACGLTHPALYHYFAGKEDLYVAMLLEEIGRLRGVLERLVRREEQEVLERLRRVTLFLLTSTDYDFALMQRDIASELGGQAQTILERAFLEGVIEPLSLLFREGQEQEAIHDFTPEGLPASGLATLLLALIAHFLTSRRREGVGVGGIRGSAAIADLIMHLLLEGVSTGPRRLPLSGEETDEVS